MAVQEQLALVAKKEGFALPVDLGARVAVASQRNLRRALLMLEVAYVQHGVPLADDTKISPPDWEMYIGVSGACVRDKPSAAAALVVWRNDQR
jgi:replication factor C subunit 3/5